MRILLFNFGLAFLVSVLFSLAPALRFLHPDLVNSLKQQTTTGSGGHLRFRRVSVGVQIGLSLLLLIGAGLFVQTLHNLKSRECRVRHRSSAHLRHRSDRWPGTIPSRRSPCRNICSRFWRRSLECARSAGTDDPELAGNDEQSNVSFAGHPAKPDEDIHVEMAGGHARLLLDHEHPAAGRAQLHRSGRGRQSQGGDHQCQPRAQDFWRSEERGWTLDGERERPG